MVDGVNPLNRYKVRLPPWNGKTCSDRNGKRFSDRVGALRTAEKAWNRPYGEYRKINFV